jgi:hypothetical protein
MKFRTEIEIEKFESTIEHSSNILTMGSCFAENIAQYFRDFRFNVLSNPFGVLYNPISILNSLNIAIKRKAFLKSDLIQHQSEWHSFYHHSDFSNHDVDEIINNINSGIKRTNDFLKSTDVLIVTFGTAFVYQHIKSKAIVSNCHKIPQKEFKHFMLSLTEVKNAISEIVKIVRTFNPKVKFIFTVSPVRHWKNGAVNNQLSKSTLLLAIDEVVNDMANCKYFPSYEIMMDDLRDYRFYNSDLVHPNKMATDYIWEKFSSSICSDSCIQTMKEISKIVSARNHRVRNVNSDEHQKFVSSMINKIEMLHKKYKHLSLQEDLDYFKSQITI